MKKQIIGDSLGPEYLIKFFNPRLKVWAFLVIDNTRRGPGKGGIRMTDWVNEAEVIRLARAMTLKNALAGIPFGGAKAGIAWNPKQHSLRENKRVVEWFGRALRPLAPEHYIAAPDINIGEREIAWLVGAVGERRAATGKPRRLGGLPHELGSTGFGVAEAARLAARFKKIPLRGATAAIEGFGNVGWFAARFLDQMGVKIVAVGDSRGAVAVTKGFHLQTLLATKRQTGSVVNYPAAQQIRIGDLLTQEVDFLIPAALPDIITTKNASRIRAKIVIEGSNLPASDEAEKILHHRNVLVIPDVVANAGGVISSYAEHCGWDEKRMFTLVKRKIHRSVNRLLAALNKHPRVLPRQIALEIAKQRLGITK